MEEDEEIGEKAEMKKRKNPVKTKEDAAKERTK